MEKQKKKVTKKQTTKKPTKATKKVEKTTINEEKKIETIEEKIVGSEDFTETTNEPIDEIDVALEKTKKRKTELKRSAIIIGFISLMLLILLGYSLNIIRKSANMVKTVEETLASNEPKMIYIKRDGCTYCTLNENNMESMKKEYNIEYLEINSSNLKQKDLDKILELLKVDTSTFGTPYTFIVQNNDVTATLDGIKGYDELFNFLQENKIINSDATLTLNYINYDEYKEIIKATENQIIVLASSTCHYCLSERPILDEIATEYNVKINWMYLDNAFTDGKEQSEYEDFKTTLSWYNDNSSWGTPTTLIVKDSNVVAALSGYRTKDEIIKFYKQNGLINE